MTISTTTVKAGPFNGNGSSTTFTFNFKVFDPAHLAVYWRDAVGNTAQLVYGTDYSVSLNANQDTNPGGSITFPISGSSYSVLATGEQLSIVHCPPKLQKVDLADGSAFRAQTIEDMADYLTVITQCLQQQLDCTVGFDAATCSFSNANLKLPAPVPGAHICWNPAGDGLTNCTGAPGSIPANPGANGDIVVWNSGGLDTLGSTIIAGTANNLITFNADGDIVDSGVALPSGTTGQHAKFDASGALVGEWQIAPPTIADTSGNSPNTISLTAPVSTLLSNDMMDDGYIVQWQVATDNGFTNIVLDSGKRSTWYKDSLYFGGSLNTTYYVRCRIRIGAIVSPWSNVISFTRTTNALAIPTVKNIDGRTISENWCATNSETPTIEINPPVQLDGTVPTHNSTDWEIYDEAGNLIEQSLGDTTNLVLYSVSNSLDVCKQHRVRFRIHTSAGTSDWAETWFNLKKKTRSNNFLIGNGAVLFKSTARNYTLLTTTTNFNSYYLAIAGKYLVIQVTNNNGPNIIFFDINNETFSFAPITAGRKGYLAGIDIDNNIYIYELESPVSNDIHYLYKFDQSLNKSYLPNITTGINARLAGPFNTIKGAYFIGGDPTNMVLLSVSEFGTGSSIRFSRVNTLSDSVITAPINIITNNSGNDFICSISEDKTFFEVSYSSPLTTIKRFDTVSLSNIPADQTNHLTHNRNGVLTSLGLLNPFHLNTGDLLILFDQIFNFEVLNKSITVDINNTSLNLTVTVDNL